jgi:polygalacturonase
MRTLLFLLIGAHAWGAGPFFNILDYGARNDGSAPATESIHAAIQAAKAAGGGTVYIPAGKYVSGPIELVSNLVLHIEAGAVVRFPATRLPFTQGRQQGIECLTPVPLVGGRNLENVTIAGRGLLTTNHTDWLDLMGRPGRACSHRSNGRRPRPRRNTARPRPSSGLPSSASWRVATS